MKNSRLPVLLLGVLFSFSGFLLSQPVVNVFAMPVLFQQPETVIPLEGLDPVLLAQGKEVTGNMKISVTRGRFEYVFANEENKALFEKSPEKYEIQLDGSCARMGPQIGGNADLYSVYQGRIYIFGSGECKVFFDVAPAKYLEPAATATAPEFAKPEALKRGQAVFEKVVAAMGGAAKIDAINSYQEIGNETAVQQNETRDFKVTMLRAFPDSFHCEEVRTYGTVTHVVTSGSSFSVFSNGTRTSMRALSQVAARDFRKQALLTPFEIVRGRKSSDFKVAYVGSEKVEGVAVDELVVLSGGINFRLSVDSATGRILGLGFRGRSRSTGEIGDVFRFYSDFRAVEGLTLPFATKGLFNGQSDPEQTYVIEKMVFNVSPEPGAFEKPKQTGAR